MDNININLIDLSIGNLYHKKIIELNKSFIDIM